MIISLGCDHGAYKLKEQVKNHLTSIGHKVEDFGCFSLDSVDYPDFAFKAAEAVRDGAAERGIVLCTTGIGVCICANKVKGVRCALCTDVNSASMTRKHNDSNVLALGAGIICNELAINIVDTWLSTAFEGGRHLRRVEKISNYEKTNIKEQ